jgi:hypothetical protein
MKVSIWIIILFFCSFKNSYSQNTQHYVNAGYLLGNSKQMNNFLGCRDRDFFENKNGYFLGGGFENKKYLFNVNFTHQKLEASYPQPLRQNKSITRFNYFQLSAQKLKKISNRIIFGFGLSSNINIKSDVKYIYYLPNGQVGIIEKVKGVLVYGDPFSYNDINNPLPQPSRIAFNINTSLRFSLAKSIKIITDYHFPITSSTSNLKEFGFNSGFFQSNLNLGVSYLVK